MEQHGYQGGSINEELARLEDARREDVPSRNGAPYLSERQWGTVREDYSETARLIQFFTAMNVPQGAKDVRNSFYVEVEDQS